jgi:cyanuric acid amidohydrolase
MIGRLVQVELVAAAVKAALHDAAIADAGDVHFVQIKCPLLTPASVALAGEERLELVTDDTYQSMAYSRGASALGVAVALGEVDRVCLDDESICSDWLRYSSVASASAGNELRHCEVVVLGNSPRAVGDLAIDHDVMQDALDVSAIARAAERAGYVTSGPPRIPSESAGLVQVFAKAEADPTGTIRRRRHTMLSDSDIKHTRHARAAVGGVVASFFGDPMVYVSGGAEHQGPPGGGPVAVIARRRAAGPEAWLGA